MLSAALLLCLTLLMLVDETARLQWGNLALTLYFACVIVLLLRAFLMQLQYNPYSYNTIVYPGFALFVLFLFLTHLYITIRCFRDPGSYRSVQMLFTLVHSAKNYMFMTMPLLIAFAAALSMKAAVLSISSA